MNKSIVSYGEYHEEKDINDITISGPSITIPEGLYREEVNTYIESTELATPEISIDENGKITATVNQSAGYIDDTTVSNIHQLAVQAAQTIIPGTTDKVIAAAKYLTGVQTIKGDANLLPENILAGTSIFGVDGTFSLNNMQLIVAISGENTVIATNGTTTVTAFGNSNTFGFNNLTVGTWSVTASNSIGQSTTQSVAIANINEVLFIEMFYASIPEFTYSGSYAILNDANGAISDVSTYRGNWKIKFFTSGVLKIQILNSIANGIDVFLVGGGGGGGSGRGGGGGGGYTRTNKNVLIQEDVEYQIIVGGGGAGYNTSNTANMNGGNGGTSSAFGIYCSGGIGGNSWNTGRQGGNGGSGGGSGGNTSSGAGGSDGYNGGANYTNGGYGQRYVAGPNGETGTTREFGDESSSFIYSGGGGGGVLNDGGSPGGGGSGGGASGGGNSSSSAASNTGGGGGGAELITGYGGSGIVIIRNARG